MCSRVSSTSAHSENRMRSKNSEVSASDTLIVRQTPLRPTQPAFGVPRPGVELDAAQLDDVCLQHIARFKRPKQYRIVDSLPKNNYGKVLKTDLRSSQ